MKYVRFFIVVFCFIFLAACSHSSRSENYVKENSVLWPQSLPAQLPVFTYAKIPSADAIITNEQTQWTIGFVDAVDNALNLYQQELIASGWSDPQTDKAKNFDILTSDWNNYYIEVYRLKNNSIRFEVKKL